ncbi:MAG: type I restriction endonuclease subunit R [Candidatus Eisenbacteria bacterium]
MTPHDYTEDQLVEQPAIGLFAELGWQTVSAMEEVLGPEGTLGRETKDEVVLVDRLRAALLRLNPGLPEDEIVHAVEELSRDRSAMSLEAANRELYGLLKQGVPLKHPDPAQGESDSARIRVLDWEHPDQNDFLLVSQLTVVGTLYTCRPDLVGFVNGLPLLVVELKKPAVPARAAFDENLTHYKREIPQLLRYNAIMIASNGTDSRVGSLTADWNRFFEWKRIEREDEPRRVSLEVMLRGTCDRTRLLDLVESFTLFSEEKGGLIKIIGQNHQVLGVNNAIASMLEARKLGHGRGGVFWQTQGSGKSYSMIFFAQKVARRITGNWTFAVVTDRVELDDQIAGTYKAVGAVSESESNVCHATSGAHLRELLGGNHRYVFTLIQKFQSSDVLTDRTDVVVLTDEAHRSQYDTLAVNMRAAMPRATFLAFTGTPLIAGEERTRDVFGDYVSIYDFQQSIEDGATVPLFYENRTPALELVNADLNDDIYQLIEDAGLDDDQEAKLEIVLGRQYHLITRDDRLETVAKDIVQHFLGRGFLGKAMVVSIDKATALRMHDKVRAHWAVEIECVEAELKRYDLPAADKAVLTQRLSVLKSTDMALIVSPGQNEIEQMKKLGLDIEPHRRRMNSSRPGLDEKFKDTEDPLRLVFVCAMWLTGFDAPSCSTVYLDKPMRNHTLMQTIARANRVFPGKHSGVIVDYANVFASLEKALAIYGAGRGTANPVQDKSKLVAALVEALAAATTFCAAQRVDLAAIEAMAGASLNRLTAIEDAIEALIGPESRRREFLGHEKLVTTLYRAIKPHPAVIVHAQRASLSAAIGAAIRAKMSPNPPDITEILSRIAGLLDESITGLTIRDDGPPPMDLSKINFEALAKRFKESSHKQTELEALKAAIRARLDQLVRLNRTRANFQQKFEELIDSYNAGSRNIEQLYEQLVALSRGLDDEQQRHVRENLSEEELVIFDILTRPAPELSTEERAEVKKVVRELLAKLQELLVLNWRQKSAARSALKLAIEDTLDAGLPRSYSPEVYRDKCSAIFEHVYESYPERGQGIYFG